MSIDDRLILVIDDSEARSRSLCELIEFMDTPNVRCGTPGDWQQQIGDCKLAAVFVCCEIGESRIAGVFDDAGKLDQNVPIVLVNEGDTAHV